MKYIILSYDNGNQMVVEALGPETVLGMVADVLRGNYSVEDASSGFSVEHKVVKIEIGDVLDRGNWNVGKEGHALT